MRDCLDAHLSQIVCDKDGVVNWCIVLLEMPRTRFEESRTPLKPQHSNHNPNPLANQLWCIDFLTPSTPLIIPHRLRAFPVSLYHSNTDARFMQDGRKAVRSNPYVSVAFFSKFKIEFYCISFFLKCPHIQIAFLKSTSCDNQALVGCIPISAVAVHLNLKS